MSGVSGNSFEETTLCRMSDSEDGHADLSGFLFGNLDENNELDADYLDDVSRLKQACP